VDATNGNDSNNATSQLTPWKTIAKVNPSTPRHKCRGLLRVDPLAFSLLLDLNKGKRVLITIDLKSKRG